MALIHLTLAMTLALMSTRMALIKHTSALTLNVSGVFKDIGLIGWSVVVSGALVTSMQYVGYTIALVGVTGYSHYKRTQAAAAKVDPVTVETQPLKSSEEGQSVGQDLRQHSEVAPATPDGRQVHVGIK